MEKIMMILMIAAAFSRFAFGQTKKSRTTNYHRI